MSDYERLEMLSQRLRDFENRTVPAWQRPINDVARLALVQEIASIGRRISRWNRSRNRVS